MLLMQHISHAFIFVNVTFFHLFDFSMNFKLLPDYLSMTVLIKSLPVNNQDVRAILKYILVRIKPAKYSHRK